MTKRRCIARTGAKRAEAANSRGRRAWALIVDTGVDRAGWSVCSPSTVSSVGTDGKCNRGA